MNPIVRNVLAVLAGAVVGSLVNVSLVAVSSSVIPPPEGVDVTNMEGLKAALPLFQPKHFIFPFLAHAMGTFVGACIAARLAANNKMRLAIGIGILFLVGGITNALTLPSPGWFIALDLLVAYIPMAWMGGKLGSGGNPSTTQTA